MSTHSKSILLTLSRHTCKREIYIATVRTGDRVITGRHTFEIQMKVRSST